MPDLPPPLHRGRAGLKAAGAAPAKSSTGTARLRDAARSSVPRGVARVALAQAAKATGATRQTEKSGQYAKGVTQARPFCLWIAAALFRFSNRPFLLRPPVSPCAMIYADIIKHICGQNASITL